MEDSRYGERGWEGFISVKGGLKCFNNFHYSYAGSRGKKWNR
jgi:hypothetical protein